MDRLVQYIEQRIKTYGHINGTQAMQSNYYEIGDYKIRISDHIAYGSNANKNDYSFIIQEDGSYIFTRMKGTTDRMYLKVIQYNEARDLIRKLHELAIVSENLCEFYRPKGWNVEVKAVDEEPVETEYEKMTFDELLLHFDYIYDAGNGVHNTMKLNNVLDIIAIVLTGKMLKGNIMKKTLCLKKLYNENDITETQYNTLITKLENFGKKNEEE